MDRCCICNEDLLKDDVHELNVIIYKCPNLCHFISYCKLTGTKIEEFPIWLDIENEGHAGLEVQVRNVAEVTKVNGINQTRIYSRLYLDAGWELHHYEGRVIGPGTTKLPD